MSLRDKRQQEFATTYLNSSRYGILNLCPRFGKIRTSILILNELKPNSILIAYPDLKIEQSWKDDFNKFGYSNPNITFSTHLSLKKLTEEEI